MSFRYYIIIIILCCCCSTSKQKQSETDAAPTSAILQMTPQSRLYTAEYKIHKIITHNDVIHLKGNLLNQDYNLELPAGTRKLAFPIDVTLKAYVDLTQLSEEHIKKENGKITIILPDPKVQVTSVQINHREKKQLIDLTRSRYSDEEIQQLAKPGVNSILKLIPDMGIIETARLNTTKTLVPILTSLGYSSEEIIIQFRKPFTVDDLPLIVDPENITFLKP